MLVSDQELNSIVFEIGYNFKRDVDRKVLRFAGRTSYVTFMREYGFRDGKLILLREEEKDMGKDEY